MSKVNKLNELHDYTYPVILWPRITVIEIYLIPNLCSRLMILRAANHFFLPIVYNFEL